MSFFINLIANAFFISPYLIVRMVVLTNTCEHVCKILEESPVRWAGPNAPITTHKQSHGGGSNRVSYTPVTG